MKRKRNYSILIPHFYSLEYYEDNRKMIIEIDFRDKPLYLDLSIINKWEDPYQTIEVTEDEKIRILNNIKDFLIHERGFTKVFIINKI